MKYSAEDYAKAFMSLKESGVNESDLLSGIAKAIRDNGDQGRADKIVGAIEVSLLKENGERRVLCEVARDLNENLVSEIKSSLKPNDHIEFVVNPDLVAGTRITFDGEYQLDKSFKHRLKKCFAIN